MEPEVRQPRFSSAEDIKDKLGDFTMPRDGEVMTSGEAEMKKLRDSWDKISADIANGIQHSAKPDLITNASELYVSAGWDQPVFLSREAGGFGMSAIEYFVRMGADRDATLGSVEVDKSVQNLADLVGKKLNTIHYKSVWVGDDRLSVPDFDDVDEVFEPQTNPDQIAA